MTRKTHARFVGARVNSTLRMYMATLVRVMLSQVAVSIILMVCLGLTEGIGLLLLVPLLQLVGLDVQRGPLGHIGQFLSSGFTAVGVRPTLITVLGAYVLILSVNGLLHRWQITANRTLEFDFVTYL